jgi:UDP-N-acetylglucosamine--N-acetylmuramyl-(pentapeptide) pyrophosphoryl-undecaprenol N-acetylglucosamine transferase
VAAQMGIPTMIHESNSVAGLAVRKLESKVDIILTNFKETEKGLSEKNKIINVGNPIRTSFSGTDKAEARRKLGIPDNIKFVILSFGGSLGAPKINQAAIDVMRKFGMEHEDVMHFHSGGKNYYKNAMQMFAGYSLEKNSRLDVKEYIYDMHLYMTAADVIICRAGAMTLTELAMMKKPAILIPSPNVTDNHQYKNARALLDGGAAMLIEENRLDSDTINSAVEKLYYDDVLRDGMSAAIAKFANPDVNEQIYAEILRLIKNKAKIKQK